MTTIHLDAVGGIAGDMFVAAMLDAMSELRDRVLADAAAALPAGIGSPALIEGMTGGLRALRFGLDGGAGSAAHEHKHRGHSHEGRDHHYGAAPEHDKHHGGAGSFRDMANRIQSAALSEGAADHAVAILTILAEAEARIHRVSVEDVHFHEIADWDSLLDVVASGSIAAALPGARWTVSPLPRGGGVVPTRHGLMPVPAPATVSILTGFEWRDDGIGGERVTPTGAAILKHLIGEPRRLSASGRMLAVGAGAGARDLAGVPNMLRVLVFAETEAAAEDLVTVISFEIDDMTGEEIAVAADRLRGLPGVLDLSIGHRQGKKGRSMNSFRVLARPDTAATVVDRCFLETSTIGLRIRDEARVTLPRQSLMAEFNGRAVGVKAAQRPGGKTTAKAESDDLVGDSLEARRRMRRLAECGTPE